MAVIKCPLCGLSYESKAVCTSCPLAKACQLSCCPNCGYALPQESSLVRLWQKVTGRNKTGGRNVRKAN